MVYQGATGLYHFLINVIPFISNSEWYTGFKISETTNGILHLLHSSLSKHSCSIC